MENSLGFHLVNSGVRTPSVVAHCDRIFLQNRNHHTPGRFKKLHGKSLLYPRKNPNLWTLYFNHGCYRGTRVLSSGRNYQMSYNDDSHTENYWSSLIREAIWNVRSLFFFLVEQPSQLKYIEWPSFQSTLKTATLTLVLVALLIVALSSVDSALSYLLALFLRRKA